MAHRWKRSVLFILFFIGWIAVNGTLAAAENTNESQEQLREEIRKLQQKKSEVDEIISSLSGKPGEMQQAQKTLADTYKYLAKQKIRLKGIQMWNGFVAFTGVAMDSLQKVNPGSSVVTATATFLQDRAAQAIPNPPLEAKIKRLAADMKSLAPSLRLLDRAMNMTPKEVADELFARGMVDNSWVNRYSRTPETIANSAAVITGKITFIRERIDPALHDLFSAKKALDGAIADTALYVETARKKSMELRRTINQLESRLEIEKLDDQKVFEPVMIKETPEVSMDNVPAMSPGQALGEVKSAWGSLKSSDIDGETYRAVKKRMGIAVNNWINQTMEPLRKQSNEATDYLFNKLPPILENIKDRYVRKERYNAASERAGKLSRQYKKELYDIVKKRDDEFVKPLNEHLKVESEEVYRLKEFCSRMKALVDEPVTSCWLDTDTYEVKVEDGKYDTISSGEYWAGLSWGGVSRSIYLLHSRFKTEIQKTPEKADALARDTIRQIEMLISGTGQAAAQIKAKLAQAAGLAGELENNVHLFRFLAAQGGCQDYSSYEAWVPHLKVGVREFNTHAAAYRKAASADAKWTIREIQNHAVSSRAVAGRPKLIEEAQAVLGKWKQARQVTAGNGIDPDGDAMGRFLEGKQVSRENTDKIRQLIEKLGNSPEAIEQHVLKTDAGRNWEGITIPDIESVAAIREEYDLKKKTILENRQSYAEHQEQYQEAYAELEKNLSGIRSKLVSAAPSQIVAFSLENIMAEAGQDAPLEEWDLPGTVDLPPLSENLDEQVQAYQAVVTRYQRLVEPYREKARGKYDSAKTKLQALVVSARTMTGKASRLEPAAFEKEISELSEQAKAVYSRFAFLDAEGEKSDIGTSYQAFLEAVNRADKTRINAWRIQAFSQIQEIDQAIRDTDIIEPEKKARLLEQLNALIAPGSLADQYREDNQVSHVIRVVQSMIEEIENRPEEAGGGAARKIAEFYNDFAMKYSGKDLYGVIDKLDSGWETPDGSTAGDLEMILNNSFNVFDEIVYTVSNLTVTDLEDGTYQVSYSSNITGTILEQDIRHEENSNITEIVSCRDGECKILETRQGQFWKK